MSTEDFDYAAAAVRVLKAAGGPMTEADFWNALMQPSTGLPESDRESYYTGPFEPGPYPRNFVKLKISAALVSHRLSHGDTGTNERPEAELQGYGAEVFRGGAGHWLREWGPLPADEQNRRRELREMDESRGSSTPPVAPKPVASANPEKAGGCYIATAIYGSYDAPEVLVLRHFRDQQLSRSRAGRALIRGYYAVSPGLAAHFGGDSTLNRAARSCFDALVRLLNRPT
jgi:hypothetical protein